VCICVYVCVCLCVCVYVRGKSNAGRLLYTYMYTHMCIYTYTYTHIHIHTYMNAGRLSCKVQSDPGMYAINAMPGVWCPAHGGKSVVQQTLQQHQPGQVLLCVCMCMCMYMYVCVIEILVCVRKYAMNTMPGVWCGAIGVIVWCSRHSSNINPARYVCVCVFVCMCV